MDKYIKQKDALEVWNKRAVTYVKAILELPTIEVMEYPQVEGITPTLVTTEVSEDCISRNYLEEQLQQIEDITAMAHIDLGEDPYDETEEITMPISTVRKIFKNAPSVLPKVNKNEWVEEFSDDGWRWVKDEL